MSHEDLITCIETAFGWVDRPPPEELAADDTYMDQSFIDGVGEKTWQELRPLRRYVPDGSEIVLLSPEAYQYYIPAYLVALIDASGEGFYLDGVLDSLWYESGLACSDDEKQKFFDPHRGLSETLRELTIEMPYLTDEQRKSVAQMRADVAAKLARVTELTEYDFFDESYLRASLKARWDARMPLLTNLQKQCIARVLVHILGRISEADDSVRIQNRLDKYWGAFLRTSEPQ